MANPHTLFEPDRVAVIGATDREGSIGRAILENLLADFEGEVVPINPSRKSVLGRQCLDSITDSQEPIELAIVVVPVTAVLSVLEEIGEEGIRDVVVITAGFGEVDEDGRARQRKLVEVAETYELNLLGPNSLGLINTVNGLNATFAQQNALPGSISMMSQSGAFVTAVLDWAFDRDIGFRQVVSLGNEAVLDEEDFMATWAADPETDVILGYAEEIKRGQAFIETARTVTPDTPVVMLKSGRSTAGAKAAASHTGSLAGSDRVYDAAFRQSGVIRANTIEELFDFGRALAGQPTPNSNGVAVVTNAGGPGVIAADAIGGSDLTLAEFSARTRAELDELLPDAATIANPLDILGDADLARFDEALRIVLDDASVGGLVVIACPTAIFDHADLADRIGALSAGQDRPILACLMGGERATTASKRLDAFDIPNYFDPVRAVQSLAVLEQHRTIRQQDTDDPREFETDDERVGSILTAAAETERGQLGVEAMEILEAFDILLRLKAEESRALGY